MSKPSSIRELRSALERFPRAPLALLPTPLHRIERFGRALGLDDLWIKRDDLTGLEGGGNKTRKLEFLVGEAIEQEADTLVTIGALQSNHTRQTAAAAAKVGLECCLLHLAWTDDAGPHYRLTGNLLLSSVLGAELYLDSAPRPIEDQKPIHDFVARLKETGRRPYLIPGGASEHPLGSLGYVACAAEIATQTIATQAGAPFDAVVHCTGSSSTQAGLLAGLRALGERTRVIGISDDHETAIKRARVLQLAREALETLQSPVQVTEQDVEVVAVDASDYGKAEPETFEIIRRFAKTTGVLADPVYEGKALRGLERLVETGSLDPQGRVLLMHLGGTPAVHAYADSFGAPELIGI